MKYESDEEVQQPEKISWHVHERDMCRVVQPYQIIIKVLCITLVFALLLAGLEAYLRHIDNLKWLEYLNQYDFANYDYTQDGQGLNIIGSGNGVDYNVPASTGESQDKKEPQNCQGTGGAEKGKAMMSER